jgi:hypothetical protein
MGCKYRTYGHLKPGFFSKLSPGGGTDILIILHMTTGDAPHTPVGTQTPNKQETFVFHQNNGHTDGGISIVHKPATITGETASASMGLDP